jgi:hypothetical protein
LIDSCPLIELVDALFLRMTITNANDEIPETTVSLTEESGHIWTRAASKSFANLPQKP